MAHDDVLDLSRIEGGALHPELEPHELEHAPAQRRESQVLPGAQFLRRGEGVLDAVIVIVVVRSGLGQLLHASPDLPSSYRAIIRPVLP